MPRRRDNRGTPRRDREPRRNPVDSQVAKLDGKPGLGSEGDLTVSAAKKLLGPRPKKKNKPRAGPKKDGDGAAAAAAPAAAEPAPAAEA